MVGELRPFGELFAEGTRNGLTRPKAVRGAGVKMVNMGELFAHSRIKNAAMDRVPLNDAEAEKFLLHPGDLLFARQSLVLEGAGKCSIFLGDDEPVTFESHVTRVRLAAQHAIGLLHHAGRRVLGHLQHRPPRIVDQVWQRLEPGERSLHDPATVALKRAQG